jgi:hypothetical protein
MAVVPFGAHYRESKLWALCKTDLVDCLVVQQKNHQSQSQFGEYEGRNPQYRLSQSRSQPIAARTSTGKISSQQERSSESEDQGQDDWEGQDW